MRYENSDGDPVDARHLQRPNLAERDLIDRVTWYHADREAVATSANDREHSPHSLHPEDLAIDLRIWNVRDVELYRYNLAIALGADFDVVSESDHIHIEFDRRGK